ncbi:MAG: ATP-dependent Clp protease ATP-binding subunit [Deltaproteobacteria bacterium]|nr:ATP-dependent Clp protease ATP-binding subunit [Deltaproteobacteria bacterium]
MGNFIIELACESAFRKERVLFSDEDILRMRQQAGDYPVSPMIVHQIKKKAGDKGFLIDSGTPELFSIARDMLLDGEGLASITGHYADDSATPRWTLEPKKSIEIRRPFHLLAYHNHLEDLTNLAETIRAQGRIPVTWSKAGGFKIEQLSVHYPLFDNINVQRLSDPKEAIKFVISRPQKRIAYIFEDFHHYLGAEETINPVVGELRALTKELYAQADKHGVLVYFFVPYSYKPPSELEPFFESSRISSDAKVMEYLDRYGQKLTDQDYLRRIKPVIGATEVIDRVIQILAQMEANNPLLIGRPGVGKTAMVDGLARAIYQGRVPPHLKNRMVYSISLAGLIAGTRYRGDLEARVEGLMSEVIENKRGLIIFFDEIHTLVDAGAAEGGIGVGDILKPVLARGEFPCIGATTITGADRLLKDPALARRFKKVMVHEPSAHETLEILRGVLPSLEKHHGLSIDDEALVSAIELSRIYIRDEYLPSKAISLVDGAAAYSLMRGRTRVTPKEILEEINRWRDR